MNKKRTRTGGALEFKGLSINSGKVVSKVCVYSGRRHYEVASRNVDSEDAIKDELRRLDNAVAECSKELEAIAESVEKGVGKTEAEIFITQMHIINDPVIIDEIVGEIVHEKKIVETAVSTVYSRYEEKFAALDNKYLSERSSDVGEIKRRLLDKLLNTKPGFNCEGQSHCTRGKERVIVAEELTAEMMVHMNLEHVRGIITEHGGVSSHAAIIARSVGVPAVSGVHDIYKQVFCGDTVILDGDNGVVIVRPDEQTVARFESEVKKEEKTASFFSTPKGIEVLANVSMLEDVHHALSAGADGIGLFRTEISFMRAERLLSEDEQYKLYAETAKLMQGKPVTFRLLDVGGDKDLPFLQLEKEANPYLGWRGSRFLLGSAEIFSAQVKALLRLSTRGKVRILFPMVIDSMQLDKLIKAVKDVMLTVDSDSQNVELGAMFEVPSAFIQAEAIFSRVDFASIGSNDLIQYLFAVDRNNETVSDEYNPEHPALWSVLGQLSDAAKRAAKPLSICGEMAGRPGMPSRFLDIGINALSVSPLLIQRVKHEIIEYKKGKV